MLHNIDLDSLNSLKERDAEAALIIETLLENHHQIVSTISHEIRNPLTLVYSSLQLIASKYPQALNFQFWDCTMDSLEYMKELLEEFSHFSTSTELNCTCINPSEFIRSIVLSHSLIQEDSSVHFISNLPKKLPFVNIDKLKFKEVLLNLIANAYDAIEEGGTISIVAEETEDDELLISVIDDGKGMTQVQLSHIFELFKTYKPNGTGLGLPISRRIIEAHGGTLTATSAVDIGSIFMIRLPIHEYTH